MRAHGLAGKNTLESGYDPFLIAFVLPTVSIEGRNRLEAFGFSVLEKELPVPLEEIEGPLR